MSQCRQSVRLDVPAQSVGLLEDVQDLSAGGIRLRLEGYYQCLDVGLPFYKFDIMDTSNETPVGEITFMPEPDLNVVASLGHSGGGLTEAARGKGFYGLALQALVPLVRRHGFSQFVIAVGQDNMAAVKAVEKLKLAPIEPRNGLARYIVAA